MFKKIVLILLVVILVGVGFFLVKIKKTTKSTMTNVTKQEDAVNNNNTKQEESPALIVTQKKSINLSSSDALKINNDKILEFLKKEGIATDDNVAKLRSIIISSIEAEKYQFQYAYRIKDEAIIISYNSGNGEIKLANRTAVVSPDMSDGINKTDNNIVISVGAMSFFQTDYPELPVAFLENSLEKSVELLENNEKYQEETKKNPELFEKLVAMAVYEKDKGWMWRFDFFNNVEGKNESLGFTVNPESGKEAVIVSDGKEAV